LAIWGSTSCVDPQGPSSVFGSYQLTGYIRNGADLPLPYVNGDSTSADEWIGGTLILRSDSTWTNEWQIVHCQSGVCGAPQSQTQYGTFNHFAERDSAGGVALVFWTLPVNIDQNGAVVRGRRLELNASWVYER
jgi:hypothetical protein